MVVVAVVVNSIEGSFVMVEEEKEGPKKEMKNPSTISPSTLELKEEEEEEEEGRGVSSSSSDPPF